MTNHKKDLKIVCLLALLVFAAYFNSLNNDFVSDDIAAIAENPALTSTNYFAQDHFIFLRPQIISTAVKIFGLNRAALRLLNILFHLGTALTAYFFIKRLSGAQAAFFAAIIFAAHPFLSESVAWISGGTYAQFNFFILLALLLYAYSLKNKKFYPVAIGVYLLGLFSTDRAIIFFPLLFLYTAAFRDLGKDWKRLIPFFILSCIWGLHLAGSFSPRIEGLMSAGYAGQAMLNPLVQIPVAITSYLELIFWPQKLTLYHSEMSFTFTQYIARGFIFLIFLAVIIFSWRRSRQIFFWLSFFMLNLLPTLTPFGISWIVAERYGYLASLGIITAVSLGLGKISGKKHLKLAVYIIFPVIIVALILRTILRNADWKNQDHLWLATAVTSPSCHYNHNNLGDLYSRRGELSRAVEEFKRAIELAPHYADAHHNLANTYQQMGEIGNAIKNYQQAIVYNPSLWQSYQSLAAIYVTRQDLSLAKEYMRKAAQINPKNSYLRANLAVILLQAGEREEAGRELEDALRLDPENQFAWQLLQSLP